MLRHVCAALSLASAAAVCAEVKKKLAELHIDVLSSIEARFGAPPSNSTPEQLRLSLTGAPGEFFVTWVVPDAGDVCADSHATVAGATFPAAWSTYEAGVAGWAGHVYTAKVTGLTTAPFSYTVTSCGRSTGPVTAAPPRAVGPNEDTLVAVMADMGTVIPAGYLTADRIAKDHAAEPFDLFVLAGDVSYATVDPPKNEFEEVWDAYGRITEPFTKFAPFVRHDGVRAHFPAPPLRSSHLPLPPLSFPLDGKRGQSRAHPWHEEEHLRHL